MTVVDHLDQITARLRRMDDQLGGDRLLDLVHQQLRFVTSLLDERRYTDAVGRRLYGTAGELLRLAGFVCFDSGQHAAPSGTGSPSCTPPTAAAIGHWAPKVLGFWSCQAKDIGQICEAVRLAETVRAGYRGATPAITVILELRAAEAHAGENATTATRRAIDAAFDALDRPASSAGPPDWCYWMDQAQAHAQAGYCYLKLGDHARARFNLRHGLALQDSSYSREGALRHALLASIYLQQDKPELDQALAHGDHALDALAGEVDSARCIGHLSRLTDALRPYRRSPGAAEFIDRARPLLARTP